MRSRPSRFWILFAGMIFLAGFGLWAGRDIARRSKEVQAQRYEAKAREIRDRLKPAPPTPSRGSETSLTDDKTRDPTRQAFQAQIDAFRKTNSEAERREILERVMAMVERDPEFLAALLSQLTRDPREPDFPAMLRVNPPMLDPLPLAVARLIGERHLLEASLLALRRLPPDEAAALLGFFHDCSEHEIANMRMSAVVDPDVRSAVRLLFAETADPNLKDAIVQYVEKDAAAPDIADLLQQAVADGGRAGCTAVSSLAQGGSDASVAFLVARLQDPGGEPMVRSQILNTLGQADRPAVAAARDCLRPTALSITAVIPSQDLDVPNRCLHAAALNFLGKTHDPDGFRIATKYATDCGDKSITILALTSLCDYPTEQTAQFLSNYANDQARPFEVRKQAVIALFDMAFRSSSWRPYLETLSRESPDYSIRELAKKHLSGLPRKP